MSKDIPLVVSTVLDERSYRETKFDMTWDDVKAMLKPLVGNEADKVLQMYRDEDFAKPRPSSSMPASSPTAPSARALLPMAERKAAQGGAPVWTYLWTTGSPAYGDRYGATHGIDVSPSMHDLRFPLLGPNARVCPPVRPAGVGLGVDGGQRQSEQCAHARVGALRPEERATPWCSAAPTNVVSDPRKAFREVWAQKSVERGLGRCVRRPIIASDFRLPARCDSRRCGCGRRRRARVSGLGHRGSGTGGRSGLLPPVNCRRSPCTDEDRSRGGRQASTSAHVRRGHARDRNGDAPLLPFGARFRRQALREERC